MYGQFLKRKYLIKCTIYSLYNEHISIKVYLFLKYLISINNNNKKLFIFYIKKL